MAHRPAIAAGIAEADVLEDEALADGSRHRGRARGRADRRLHLEEVEQVFQVEALLVDVARAEQQALDQVAAARERGGEEGQRAERDRAPTPRSAG